MTNVSVRKVLLLIAAFLIVVLNLAHLALPALAAYLPPNGMALINAVVAAVVVGLHILQENGVLTDKDLPGLSAVTGGVTATAKVTMADETKEATDAIKSVEVAITGTPKTDAAAVPAAPSATPAKDAP